MFGNYPIGINSLRTEKEHNLKFPYVVDGGLFLPLRIFT